jgi:hypothetical protein
MSGQGAIEVLSRRFTGVTEESAERLKSGDSAPAEIRTEILPNTSPHHYQHINHLGCDQSRKK